MPEGLDNATQVWLVRHGETEWSRNGRHTSVTDLPLTDLGREQATAVRDILDAGLHARRPAIVLCSPRRRALQTVELAGLTVDEVTEDLAEWNYGDYEGLTSAQIQQREPDWRIWTRPCPGGETAAAVQARADRVLARAREHSDKGPVILVSHGHFSRVLGIRWIGLPIAAGAHFALDTAAPSLLGAEHHLPVIDHWNIPNPRH